jgi:hypothetical protein
MGSGTSGGIEQTQRAENPQVPERGRPGLGAAGSCAPRVNTRRGRWPMKKLS